MLEFKLLTPVVKGGLNEQLDSLYLSLGAMMKECAWSINQLLFTRIYLTDSANQLQDVMSHKLWKSLIEGAVSVIEQPLLCNRKVALCCAFSTETDICKTGSYDRLKITIKNLVLLFHSVRFVTAESLGLSSEEQTVEAFKRHEVFLKEENMTLEEHCHRTWFFVRDVDRNYQGVVVGRNKVFARQGLTEQTHYIASTGIGGFPQNSEAIVSADFLSIKGINRTDVHYLQALEYLNPTREYGVAFERGTSIDINGQRYLMLSGTASIDSKGQVVHQGNILAQAKRLFLNIEKLLNGGGATLDDMEYAIVYLRDISDYEEVSEFLRTELPQLPSLILEARVCRPGWLIEVEGVARKVIK